MSAADGSAITMGHRVWRVGSDVSTDALAPGHAMKFGIDKIAQHCLESLRPEFAQQARPGDIVVAGPNFGIGSSREQAAAALLKLGIAAVVAPSFGGLFFRNAFNLGLLLLVSPDVDSMAEGDIVSIDRTEPALVIADGRRLRCDPVPGFLLDMVQAGGLLNQLRKRALKDQRNAA